MLKSIMRALTAHDNGADAWDIVFHVRGQHLTDVGYTEVLNQLDLLVARGVLMMHGRRYMFIDKVMK
jgi:RNase P protein component